MAKSNEPPDETEQQWRFEHPRLSDLPSLCQKSLLVHGHRVELVRFRKLLHACNGMQLASLEPASEVDSILDKTVGKFKASSKEEAETYVESMAGLISKKEDLLSQEHAPPADDMQAYEEYLHQKYARLKAIFAEESQAAVLYVQLMLPHQIKS